MFLVCPRRETSECTAFAEHIQNSKRLDSSFCAFGCFLLHGDFFVECLEREGAVILCLELALEEALKGRKFLMWSYFLLFREKRQFAVGIPKL